MRLLTFVLLSGMAWPFGFQVARAQSQASDEDPARAAARFQQAVELYREGSFEGALAEFRKAYQLSPSYRVLYNIAQTQYALHDFVGAQRSLTQYLTDGGVAISAERRAQVDDMMTKLEDRIGFLEISTSVTGADLRVDYVGVGTSPLSGIIPVNVGPRRVSASKTGSPDAVRVVTVAGRERLKVELNITEHAVSPSQPVPASSSAPEPTAAPPVERRQSALTISLTSTAVLAVGTASFAYLAFRAQQDLKDQLDTFPNTRDKIEDARSRSKLYGYITDACGAATLISGGVALYLALSDRGEPRGSGARKARQRIALVPSLGGVALVGGF